MKKIAWALMLLCSILFLDTKNGDAQTLLIDSTFQPHFDIRTGLNAGSIRDVWENPKNGKILIAGGFDFTLLNPRQVHGSYTMIQRNGNRDFSFVGSGFSSAGAVSNIIEITDSAIYLNKSNALGAIDSTGISVRGSWLINARKTVQCMSTEKPFYFNDGSFLFSNSLGNLGSCKIINPPDTFSHRYIVKVNPQGLWDSTFLKDANSYPSGFVAYDSNRIIVYGNPSRFTHYDSVRVNGLCRIFHDGTLDTTFKTPILSDTIENTRPLIGPIESDGKFILHGRFYLKDSSHFQTMIRLNSDGSLDSTFNNFNGPDDTLLFIPAVQSVAKTEDNGYLVGGYFNNYQGYFKNNIAKIDSNGYVEKAYFKGLGPDSSFILGSQGIGIVYKILPSKFGGYYVAGDFLKWDGNPTQPIVRLKESSATSIDEVTSKNESMLLYPNPVNQSFVLQIKKTKLLNFQLFNSLGQQFPINYAPTSEGYRFDASHLPKGMYVLHIFGEQAQSLKFIKTE